MKLPNDDLTAAWSSIDSGLADAHGWRSIAISVPGAAVVHAGRRFPGGAEALLVRFGKGKLPAELRLPEGGGFLVERVEAATGHVWVSLTRKGAASLLMFTAMASDVAGALAACSPADEARIMTVLLGRVRAWQEFMHKGGGPLQPEAEIGLFAELRVLLAIVDEGVEAGAACIAWTGPERGLRDFEIGTGAIEVKATLANKGFLARIGSLDQLDDQDRQPLFMAAVRLRQTPGGCTLPTLVGLVRDVVAGDPEAERILGDRLIAGGYRDEHESAYVRALELARIQVMRVEDGFPRMVRYDVPPGVVEAAYVIDLEAAPTPSIELAAALKELKAM